jgi:hypothetical protein
MSEITYNDENETVTLILTLQEFKKLQSATRHYENQLTASRNYSRRNSKPKNNVERSRIDLSLITEFKPE